MLKIWSFDFSYLHGGQGRLDTVTYRASVPPTTDATLRAAWHEAVYDGLEGLLDGLFVAEDAAAETIGKVLAITKKRINLGQVRGTSTGDGGM